MPVAAASAAPRGRPAAGVPRVHRPVCVRRRPRSRRRCPEPRHRVRRGPCLRPRRVQAGRSRALARRACRRGLRRRSRLRGPPRGRLRWLPRALRLVRRPARRCAARRRPRRPAGRASAAARTARRNAATAADAAVRAAAGSPAGAASERRAAARRPRSASLAAAPRRRRARRAAAGAAGTAVLGAPSQPRGRSAAAAPPREARPRPVQAARVYSRQPGQAGRRPCGRGRQARRPAPRTSGDAQPLRICEAPVPHPGRLVAALPESVAEPWPRRFGGTFHRPSRTIALPCPRP